MNDKNGMELITRSQATWSRMLNSDDKIIQAETTEIISRGGKRITLQDAARMSKRDLTTSNFSSGGALVQTTTENEVIEYLRPKSTLIRAGATVLENVALPRVIPSLESDPKATWLPENVSATESDITVAQRQLTPYRLTTTVTYSKLVDIQSAPDFEAVIADAAMGALMQGIDFAGLQGVGGASPVGILNLAGTGELSFSGAPTLAKILAFENSLESSNVVDDGTMAWFLSPSTATVFKQTLKTGNNTAYLMGDDGRINGQKSFQTTSLSATNQVIYCKASDVVITLLHGGLFLVRDPFTRSDSGETRFTATIYADITLKHVQSACISLDSGSV
ncbi:MAG: phage major capsid protein [Methylacidiphilales bacterium]|nr:phage major capsid protein [Candidatus Methylacidiphilales bacterium]